MLKRLRRRLCARAFARDRSGLAAIEFAITAPFLAVMLIGAADVGILVYNRMDTASSIQAGAQYFMAGGVNTEEALNAVRRSWTSMPEQTELGSDRICYCAEIECSCTQNCADGSLPVAYNQIWARVVYQGTLIETEYFISENVRVR